MKNSIKKRIGKIALLSSPIIVSSAAVSSCSMYNTTSDIWTNNISITTQKTIIHQDLTNDDSTIISVNSNDEITFNILCEDFLINPSNHLLNFITYKEDSTLEKNTCKVTIEKYTQLGMWLNSCSTIIIQAKNKQATHYKNININVDKYSPSAINMSHEGEVVNNKTLYFTQNSTVQNFVFSPLTDFPSPPLSIKYNTDEILKQIIKLDLLSVILFSNQSNVFTFEFYPSSGFSELLSPVTLSVNVNWYELSEKFNVTFLPAN